jgi:hypothetical protein
MSSYRSAEQTGSVILIGLILNFIFVIGWAPPASAVGNLQLGPVELHPSFMVTEAYDDNVCRTENRQCQDPKNSNETKDGTDNYTIFSPGLQVALPFQTHRFEAEYRGDWGRYNEFKTENYTDNNVKGRLALHFPGGLSVRGKEEYTSGHDAPGTAQNIQIDFFHRNTAGGGLDFEVGPKLRLAVDYTNLILNYADDARNGFRDRTDNTVGGTIYYKFMPKTSALVEYDYTATNFDESNPALLSVDNKTQRGYLGLTWDITARSQGTAKAGYAKKNYQESGVSNFQGGIVSIALSHELTQRTSLKFDAVRDVQESNIVNQPYYLTTGGRLVLNHNIHPKVSFKMNAGFSRDQYPDDMTIGTETRKRMDDTWVLGGRFEYRIQQWLNLGLGYDHSQRRSTFSDFGYVDNLYTFSVGALL